MFKDVIIPSKIGHYYLFSKKVLSIDVTPFAVYGLLLQFSGNKVHVASQKNVVLKDSSDMQVIEAMKEITKHIDTYDEVVTALSSSAIIYKELKLPFVGREKLQMIVKYEVESLLPFSLDQAVLDFMIVHEDHKNKQSTIMVAAALKEQIDAQYRIFEKAGIALHMMTVDMFALYGLYHQSLVPADVKGTLARNQLEKNFKKELDQATQESLYNQVDLLIDFGFDGTRALYVQNGILKAVRIIPYGVVDIAELVGVTLELSDKKVLEQLVTKTYDNLYTHEIKEGLEKLCVEISKTLSSFEKQVAEYQKPKQIMVSGLGCRIHDSIITLQAFFDMPVQQISMDNVTKNMNISVPSTITLHVEELTVLSIGLSNKYHDDINFLQRIAHKADNQLLITQLVFIILLTLGSLGGLFWQSSMELEEWVQAYNVSKKDLIKTIEQSMKVDLRKDRTLKDIVKKAESTLQKEHQLWFAFSKQTEHSYLEYLQDLSIHIDRASVGLDLKKLSMTPDKVSMTGSLKSFESLEVFEEELSELSLLTLKEKPRELSFSNLELTVKNKDKHNEHV